MDTAVNALVPVSAVSSTQKHEIARRSADYHPSVWGDYFLAYASHDAKETFAEEEQQLQQLKENVQKMLNGTLDKSPRKLELIDAIKRLGVSYHFEAEIEASLLDILNAFDVCDKEEEEEEEEGNDLYTVALRFRLLRQQGHYVPCDVFNKFKSPDGKFETQGSDARGMLSLYEAANFRVRGENILDEALRYATIQLESMVPNLTTFLAKQVNQALNTPIQKTLTRLGARQYISLYEEDESHNKLLLKFAKLDFNRLQKLHQMELSGLTKWWKGLDFASNLPFARDRLVECYFWTLGVYFEPKYCLARKILTKVIAMASIMDDIYDLYGTIDELILFTDVITRWDTKALSQLPLYMRHFYKALFDIYTEMEEELAKEGKSELVNYAKSEMKKLARAYLQEAYWFHNAYVPTIEEYMNVALVSGGYMMVATISLIGMGELATKEAFDWITNKPLILRAASVICRLMDDMVAQEPQSEEDRRDVASAVECYMNQYGVAKEVALDVFQKQVTCAWKDLNKECLKPTAVPMPLVERVLNLARVIDLLYKDGDDYTHSTTKTKDLITSVLVHPVS